MADTTTTTTSKNRTKLPYEPLQEGIYGTHPKDFKGAVLVHSASEAKPLGIKQQVIDQTNFETHFLVYIASGTMIIFLLYFLIGEKQTGGFKIVVKRVFQDNDSGVMEIYAKDKKPKGNNVSTMAITHPFFIARVAKPAKAISKLKFVWWKKPKKEDKKE